MSIDVGEKKKEPFLCPNCGREWSVVGIDAFRFCTECGWDELEDSA